MKKVLLTTFGLTLIAVIINGITYSTLSRRFDKEIIEIIAVLALLAAISVILGYLVARYCLTYSNFLLSLLNVLLFLVNGALIIGATILTFLFGSQEFLAFVGLPYIIAGFYTYSKTIKLIGKAPERKAQSLSENEDVLDDLFLDE